MLSAVFVTVIATISHAQPSLLPHLDPSNGFILGSFVFAWHAKTNKAKHSFIEDSFLITTISKL